MPLPPTSTLLDILTLEPDGPDRWRGRSPAEERARVFGGQVVAQALVAAAATVDAGHRVHSLHASFLRGGDVDHDITYEVDRLRDGRSFTARQVTAGQGDGAILVLTASFHAGGSGGDHAPPAPDGVPGPGGRPATAFHRPGVVETADATDDGTGPTQRRVWFRAGCELPDELHAAGLAYASDHGLFGAARRLVDREGEGRFDAMFRASLDHAIWFHRPPRVDDWSLYDIDVLAHREDRILVQGRVLDRAGRLVATVSQELLARAPGG